MLGELLRGVGPALLALALAAWFDRATEARGLLPPGFAAAPARRWAAGGLVAGTLWLGATAGLGQIGRELTIDPATIAIPQLFLVHALLLSALVGWLLLAFWGTGRLANARLRTALEQLGAAGRGGLREAALGLAAGVVLWPVTLLVMVTVALVFLAVGGEGLLPTDPPQLVLWIAGLPLAIKVALSLSAGVVEELFFRGFLQPRVGVGLSSALFVLAHLSYDEPFMLVGVAFLSLSFAALVEWRQSVWAAVVAHTLFDALQLIVLIPAVLELQAG